jgi:hypothetical protein
MTELDDRLLVSIKETARLLDIGRSTESCRGRGRGRNRDRRRACSARALAATAGTDSTILDSNNQQQTTTDYCGHKAISKCRISYLLLIMSTACCTLILRTRWRHKRHGRHRRNRFNATSRSGNCRRTDAMPIISNPRHERWIARCGAASRGRRTG